MKAYSAHDPQQSRETTILHTTQLVQLLTSKLLKVGIPSYDRFKSNIRHRPSPRHEVHSILRRDSLRPRYRDRPRQVPLEIREPPID